LKNSFVAFLRLVLSIRSPVFERFEPGLRPYTGPTATFFNSLARFRHTYNPWGSLSSYVFHRVECTPLPRGAVHQPSATPPGGNPRTPAASARSRALLSTVRPRAIHSGQTVSGPFIPQRYHNPMSLPVPPCPFRSAQLR